MVSAQLTSTITMSNRDRSDTITKGFGAGLRRLCPTGEPTAVMAAPRSWRQTVLRLATRRRRTTDMAPAGADDAPGRNVRLPLGSLRPASSIAGAGAKSLEREL